MLNIIQKPGDIILHFSITALCTIRLLLIMSENKNEKKLNEAQHDQDNVGAAASSPDTAGPAENLREKAAKAEDKSQESREPA